MNIMAWVIHLKKIFVLHSTFQSVVQNLKFVPHEEKQREMCAFVFMCGCGSQPAVRVPVLVFTCVWLVMFG